MMFEKTELSDFVYCETKYSHEQRTFELSLTNQIDLSRLNVYPHIANT